MKKLFQISFISLAMLALTACVSSDNPNSMSSNTSNTVVIATSQGDITVELYPDKAPKTVANFKKLVGSGFYDGLTFHRVEPNFVIQGGDPAGNGTGGSGENTPLEIMCEDGTMVEGKTTTCAVALPHIDGALAMARSAMPDSASSQFYITLGEQSFLNGNYAVFGQVVDGTDIPSQIKLGDKMSKVSFK